jgi:hypothetical protein
MPTTQSGTLIATNVVDRPSLAEMQAIRQLYLKTLSGWCMRATRGALLVQFDLKALAPMNLECEVRVARSK